MSDALQQSKLALLRALDELSYTRSTLRTLADNQRLYRLVVDYNLRLSCGHLERQNLEADNQQLQQMLLVNQNETVVLRDEHTRAVAELSMVRYTLASTEAELKDAEQR